MSSGDYPSLPPSRIPDPGAYPQSWNGGVHPPVYEPPQPPKRKVWLHVLLFALTLLSTTWVGGPVYSTCVLGILTAHEFGHYFAAKYHRVPATLPYFMPFPLPPLGTLGAVIRMSPYIPNRRALFDIAAAGPIAGLIVALPVSFVGIYLSQQVRLTGQEGMILGDTLLFRAMEWVVFGARGENVDLMLHPAAFAGWVGLFVTALNLLPISQLDGGHINYALFGRKSRLVAILAFVALLALTAIQGFHYSVMLLLLWFMGLTHPPTLNDAVRLDRRRRMLGILLAVVFVLCFTPAPFQL